MMALLEFSTAAASPFSVIAIAAQPSGVKVVFPLIFDLSLSNTFNTAPLHLNNVPVAVWHIYDWELVDWLQ